MSARPLNHDLSCEGCGANIGGAFWKRNKKYLCESCAKIVDEHVPAGYNPGMDHHVEAVDNSSIATGMYERIAAALEADVDEPLNNPAHYMLRDGQQAIDFFESVATPEQFEGFLRLNALKYLTRYDKKGTPAEDVRKALDYVTRLAKVVDAR